MASEIAHAALIDDQGIVRNIIVIPYLDDDDEKITEFCNDLGLNGKWIDVSYKGARRGYPLIGDKYDALSNTFISPAPPVEEE